MLPLPSPTLSRRALLGGGALGVGALLAACASDGPTADPGAVVEESMLPGHTPYDGVTPDLLAEVGRASAGFLAYPGSPVAFSSSTPGDGRPVTAIAPASFAVPPGVGQNQFWQELNERVGSPVEMTLTPFGEYTAKFATAVAGDTLPDMYIVGDTQSLPQFMSAKAADLTDHLQGDAIDAYPALAAIPTDSWRGCVFEGRIRALPIQRGLVNLPTVFVRQDLQDELGLAAPTTFEELFETSVAVTGGNRWAWGSLPLAYVRSMLDIPSIWAIEDGEFVSTLADERHEEALEAVRRLNDAGAISPDAAAAPTSTRKQWFGAGTSYFLEDSFLAWFSLYVQHAAVPGFSISALPVPGFDGGAGTQYVPNPNFGITAINAASDRVETLLEIANWMAAPFGTEEYLFSHFGIEGVHYDLDGTDPIARGDRSGELNIGNIYMSDAPRVLYSAGRAETVEDAHAHQLAVTEKSQQDATLGLYSETATRRFGSLQGTLSSIEQDIMLGRRPVSDWRGAVDDFLSGGGETIRDEYAAALAG